MRKLILAFSCILVATMAYATTPTKNAAPPSQEKNVVQLQEQVSHVENQLTIIRDYNDDFMSVILWSLGTVGAIAVVLIGFNWFQSTRTLKAEFSALREEFLASLNKTSEEQNSRLDKTISGLEKEITSVASKVADEKIRTVRGNISWLTSEVREHNYKFQEKEVEYWMEMPVPSNAVIASGELIACAIKLDNEWRISDSIDTLNKSIDLLKEDGKRLEAQELTELEAIVNQLPEAHKTAKAVLLSRLAEMHKG